jgi:phosphoglycolate phosphatase-like HAD superfamily hydrolase
VAEGKNVIRLVLFDIDGTLLRTGGVGIKAFAKAFSTEFGVHEGADKLKFSGRTDVSLTREVFTMNQIEPSRANFDRFFAAYVGWLKKMIVDCDGGACNGVLDFIRALEAHHEPPVIGLLTGNIKAGAQIKLGRFDLWEKFPFGGFADDDEQRDRIAAVAHQRGNERIGRTLRGEEVLVIGDTPLDIRCGRAIGARVIAVATGGALIEELAPHKPDWLVPDLTHLEAGRVLKGELSM